jgi:hypothetical protein
MHIIFICEYSTVVALLGLCGGPGMLQFGIRETKANLRLCIGISQPVGGWGCYKLVSEI